MTYFRIAILVFICGLFISGVHKHFSAKKESSSHSDHSPLPTIHIGYSESPLSINLVRQSNGEYVVTTGNGEHSKILAEHDSNDYMFRNSCTKIHRSNAHCAINVGISMCIDRPIVDRLIDVNPALQIKNLRWENSCLRADHVVRACFVLSPDAQPQLCIEPFL